MAKYESLVEAKSKFGQSKMQNFKVEKFFKKRSALKLETVSTFNQLMVETVSTFSQLKVETLKKLSLYLQVVKGRDCIYLQLAKGRDN